MNVPKVPPTLNQLVEENNVHQWGAGQLELACAELEQLSLQSRDMAVRAASGLYGRVVFEYRQVFEERFDPQAPKAVPRDYFGWQLPAFCMKLHQAMTSLGIAV